MTAERNVTPAESGNIVAPPPAPDAAPSGVHGTLARHGLELRLFPVFDLRRHRALTLFCVPTKLETGGTLKLGHWLLDGLPEEETAAANFEMLDCATAYAKRFAETAATVATGAMVSFSTLINPRYRKDYVDALHAVSLPERNPVVVQIEGIPPGTPMTRIADAVNQLGQVVRHVLMTVPAAGDFMWSLGALGATGIGLNLTGREGSGNVGQLAHSLMVLCRSQSALGYMNMLPTPDAAAAAAAAGVRFGTGPALSLTLFTREGPLPKIPVPARPY